MAKTGFWLQGAKGKFAGAALQKGAFGGTIMRQITTPKNPRTTPQMIQRIITATVAQAYSGLKQICDHSFEGVTYGAKSMAYFRSLNAKVLKDDLANNDGDITTRCFLQKGDKFVAPNYFVISEGSIISDLNNLDRLFISQYIPEGEEDPDGYACFIDDIRTTTTYTQFMSEFNLQWGDQLTFVIIGSEARGVNLSRNIIRNGLVHTFITRTVLTNGEGAGDSSIVDGNGFLLGTNIKAENAPESGIALVLPEEYPLIATPLAFGVIVSRKQDNEWLRSTCTLHPLESESLGHSLADALKSYENDGLVVGSNLYLNNARA